jgi:hypothetical protein
MQFVGWASPTTRGFDRHTLRDVPVGVWNTPYFRMSTGMMKK